MSWSPLAGVIEEGLAPIFVPPDPVISEIPNPAKSGLTPRDVLIIAKVFENKKAGVIAAELGIRKTTVQQRLSHGPLKTMIARVEGAILGRVARGEFGVMALAKAEAVDAMKRVIGISKKSEDDRVRLAANIKLLELAGIQAPKPLVYDNPERIIDQMSGEEADHFARTGEFPARLADQLARLASHVLEKSESARWTPRIEDMREGEDPRVPPARVLPVEMEE